MNPKEELKRLKKSKAKAFGEQLPEPRAQDKIKDTKTFILGWLDWAKNTNIFDHYAYGLNYGLSSSQFKHCIANNPELQETFQKVKDILQHRVRVQVYNEPHKTNYFVEKYGTILDRELRALRDEDIALVREKIQASKEQVQKAGTMVVEMMQFKTSSS